MYKRFAFAGLCALFVGACGSNGGAAGNEAANGAGEGRTAAQAQQASAGGSAITIRPGQWQVASTGDYEETDMECVTPEQARLGFYDPNEESSRQCQPVRNRMAGGVIDIELNCNGYPVVFRGTFTETSYQMDTSIDVPVNGERQTIRSQRTGRWVGPQCQDDDGNADAGDESGSNEG